MDRRTVVAKGLGVLACLFYVWFVQAEALGLPNLEVVKSDSPDPVTAGSSLTYTIVVTNNDLSDSATGVVMTDYLPSGVSFVSATASSGGCYEVDGVVTCFLGNFLPGASQTVTIIVVPNTPGSITNAAIADENENDSDNSDNLSTAATTVEGTAIITSTEKVAILKNEGVGDVNIYYYNGLLPGDWTYWDALARNPSPLARDCWIIPSSNDPAGMTAVGTE